MALEPKKPAEVDVSWMETYGDMVTLLLCFFVLLASISKVDANLYEKVQSGIAQEIGKQKAQRPIEDMKKELTEVVSAMSGGDSLADVATDERGVVLNLDSGAMFKQGSAEVRPEAMPLLKEMAVTLTHKRFESYVLEIQGHTDDTPVATPQYPTNFDLAAARALATLRAMKALGVGEDRMIIAAYGQYKPRVPNRTPEGNPLPVNQSLNRRVSIHVVPH